MGITWKYKIDLADENVFGRIEKSRGVKIPDTLKKLIIEANAATPDKYRFMLGPEEKVFGAVLSFNEGEPDTDSVFTALKMIEDKRVFPFAIDPFGNYICVNLEKETILFWNHETGSYFSTEKELSEFLMQLY